MRLPEHEERRILLEKKQAEFTFDNMVRFFRETIAGFPDRRTGTNSRYSIEDAAAGAFSVFFTQSPSFLSFQSAMQQTKGKNNAQSLFGVTRIPCNNHIRDLMDEVHPCHVTPVFKFVFDGLERSGHLDCFRSYNNNLLFAFDGTQYFSSNKIHCENCSRKEHKNGTVNYSHSVVTPVVVAPGNNKVIALQPEFITLRDGHNKQDCENAAAKRWINQYASHGKKHLASLLLSFNLLAFLFHTVLELTDGKYKLIRAELPTRKTFFDDLRALTRYIYFPSWEAMLSFMMRGLEIEFPDTG